MAASAEAPTTSNAPESPNVSGTQHVTQHVTHGFGPVWDRNSRVLVLGSMPSPKSREAAFYYAFRANRFWPVMAALFDDPSPVPERFPDTAERMAKLTEARRAFALRHHIALWDVIASCDIVGASDASIRNAVANDLASVIRPSEIRHVFTTGAKAAQLYRRLCLPQLTEAGFDLPMTALPSTSPANARMRLPQLIEAYRPILAAATDV
ncbi:DNA-deoxyinosine glycosylase [Bifidobacterium simiarum]|uniref:DNA-deoxyinosine glycosylase n=1 Tax=Bifidobacterium simiarum TaxID=2045441 RepID=UPI001BDC94FD|nr:DNA-deoxyinosine glycosylase [Bifidobacterium simiarum]MBT1166835.1 DNA-deoxyinosine glycosylase [Bifidobacterium simiarum]